MNKYEPLRSYLSAVPGDRREVQLTFAELEAVVGALPPSARAYRPWWGNSERRAQAQAWQEAGFIVEQVNLTAETVVFGRGRAERRSHTARVILGPVNAHPAPATRTSIDEYDQTEATVQAHVVAHLVRDGWQILRVADTASRESGLDILAGRNGVRLAVEVKGYPSRTYADARRAGEVKPTDPSTQARHWYAAAVVKAMCVRDEQPEYQVAIALPDTSRYRSLYEKNRDSLATLAIAIWFVKPDGTVATL